MRAVARGDGEIWLRNGTASGDRVDSERARQAPQPGSRAYKASAVGDLCLIVGGIVALIGHGHHALQLLGALALFVGAFLRLASYSAARRTG
jgi:hypothetical protein